MWPFMSRTGKVVFLHKIVEGSADKSYGFPTWPDWPAFPGDVIDRARVILETLESDHLDEEGRPRMPTGPKPGKPTSSRQLSLFETPPHPFPGRNSREGISGSMTPLGALEELDRIRRSLLDAS
ncbi:MAG: hypothetical protein CM1200mP2_11280 [Planctomycetaceae bacterium]|nr:MAG: hypothetical protein CM1200mP2_11280 [Planctomycetaceae bacterium]